MKKKYCISTKYQNSYYYMARTHNGVAYRTHSRINALKFFCFKIAFAYASYLKEKHPESFTNFKIKSNEILIY